MPRRLPALAGVLLGVLLSPASSLASGDDVLKDCLQHGRLTTQYSSGEYRDALDNIPTDVDEYTDCRDIIRKGQLGLGGTAGGGGDPTGAGPVRDPFAGATPTERAEAVKQIEAAGRGSGAAPRRIGGAVVTPGALAFSDFSSLSDLPAPLLLLAALIAVVALAMGAYLLFDRVRARRPGA